MTDQNRAREDRIFDAAYAVLAEKGYGGASMLTVARRARASNETLYRWYGDKRGLFAAMIDRNASTAADLLDGAGGAGVPAMQALRDLAPVLLTLLLGDRAIALNRAASSDATGELGAVLAAMGRDRLAPRIAGLIAKAQAEGALAPFAAPEAVALYLDLLVGDMQVRRCIGVLPAPGPEAIATRSAKAMDRFERLLAPRL